MSCKTREMRARENSLAPRVSNNWRVDKFKRLRHLSQFSVHICVTLGHVSFSLNRKWKQRSVYAPENLLADYTLKNNTYLILGKSIWSPKTVLIFQSEIEDKEVMSKQDLNITSSSYLSYFKQCVLCHADTFLIHRNFVHLHFYNCHTFNNKICRAAVFS